MFLSPRGPGTPRRYGQTFNGIQAVAPALGVAVQPMGMREAQEIDSAIAAMTAERADALFMISDVLTGRQR